MKDTHRPGYRLEYQRKFVKTMHDKYLGVIDPCPKCGKRGYAHRLKRVNTKTGNTWSYRQIFVNHVRFSEEKRKTVHDYTCYLGYVKMEDSEAARLSRDVQRLTTLDKARDVSPRPHESHTL